MNNQISYVPVKCSMKSCAFPFSRCKDCVCNATQFGKKAMSVKDPVKNYQFCHAIKTKIRS